MSIRADLQERLRALLFRNREDIELEEELAFHMEQETAANVRRGLDPREARRRAALRLGGVDRTAEAVRDARGTRLLEDLSRDVQYAFRSLLRTPAFTATVVLVLGIGIGATTSIYSAVQSVVLRPLPFTQPENLHVLWESHPETGIERELASPANYLDWKERVSSFAELEAYGESLSQVTITGLEQPLVLDGVLVTGGFFSMLGVRPLLGRDFTEAENWAEATWRAGETPLILSARTWRSVFGGEESVIGRPVQMNGVAARVVGVMPETFAFPTEHVDLWLPVGWPSEAREATWFRRAHSIRPVARLAPGVTAGEAAAELAEITGRLDGEQGDPGMRTRAGMAPLHAFLVGDVRAPLLVLLAAVGVMLLIACANVGGLLLVRASGRARDLAVRVALGSGRGRLVRQLLLESVALALPGGALGVVLGVAGTRVLERLVPHGFLRVTTFTVDSAVLAFAVTVTAAAALVFGSFPALLARRVSPGDTLREAGRGFGASRGTRRVVGGLVVAEVALASLLVLGAGLLVRSIAELRQVEPGFDAERVVAVTLNLPGVRYPGPPQVTAFYDELLARVRALPGVESAAASSTLPLRAPGPTSDFSIAGRRPDQYGTEVVRRSMTPGYLETMRVPLLAGRDFTDADAFTDGWDAPRRDRVALINEVMARQFFPGQDPVGQRITTDRVPDADSQWRTIVGVIGNERQSEIAMPPRIELIEPSGQDTERDMHIVVRVPEGDDPIHIVPAVRALVRDLDPALPLVDAVRMNDVVADSMARDRFLAILLAAFATVALVLALVGVYGVSAEAARRRLPEFGLRMALGAHGRDILRLTLEHGLTLVLGGLALGVAAALLVTRLLSGILYGIAPTDPITFVIVSTLLIAAGMAASWLPARRAARIDPAGILRAQ